MAGIIRLSNTGTGNGQSTITTAASGDTTYTLPSGGGTFVTTSSTQALTVPFASGTVSAPSVTFLGDSNTGIYSPAADTIAFTEGGVESLRIDSSGRVGIGTTNPQSKLAVFGTADNEEIFHIANTAGTTDGSITNRLRFTCNGNGAWANVRYNAFQHIWGSSALADSTERMRIDSSGRLLVGTSSTSADTRAVIQASSSSSTGGGKLILSRGNTSPATGAGLGYLIFSDSAHSDIAYLGAERDGGTWTSGSSHPTRLVFSVTRDGQASPTEAMRIVSSGAFKFSTSGSYLSATNTANEFTQSNDNDGLVVRATSGTFINDVVQIRASRNTTNATFYALSYYNDGAGAYKLRIADSGNVLNTNNSYGALSDFKLKENIVDATSQWSDIKALQVRKYNFKEETGQQTHTQIGLIAQEVELVSPGLVSESPDRDADGNDLGTVTKSVNYSVLYMKAVKALQEAMERIETLEAKVAALESA